MQQNIGTSQAQSQLDNFLKQNNVRNAEATTFSLSKMGVSVNDLMKWREKDIEDICNEAQVGVMSRADLIDVLRKIPQSRVYQDNASSNSAITTTTTASPQFIMVPSNEQPRMMNTFNVPLDQQPMMMNTFDVVTTTQPVSGSTGSVSKKPYQLLPVGEGVEEKKKLSCCQKVMIFMFFLAWLLIIIALSVNQLEAVKVDYLVNHYYLYYDNRTVDYVCSSQSIYSITSSVSWNYDYSTLCSNNYSQFCSMKQGGQAWLGLGITAAVLCMLILILSVKYWYDPKSYFQKGHFVVAFLLFAIFAVAAALSFKGNENCCAVIYPTTGSGDWSQCSGHMSSSFILMLLASSIGFVLSISSCFVKW